MILLDTNVLSALMRQKPEFEVVRWLDRQPRSSVWTTSVTVFEVRFGLQALTAGKRQRALTEAFEHLLTVLLENRIAPFDSAAAGAAADLMAARQKKGLPGELRDTMIAGIALATHATLATRNVRHFDDLTCPVINPWNT
jgi:toxin FitB